MRCDPTVPIPCRGACPGRLGVFCIGMVVAFSLGLVAVVATPNPMPLSPETEQPYALPENPEDLLLVDAAMRAFFATRVDPTDTLENRLYAIAEAIRRDDGLGFSYGVDGVFEAREAFRRRGGNCLSFTLLFVAVARDQGIPAVFNHVPTRPDWRRAGPLVLEVHHVNARVDAHGFSYQVDIAAGADQRLRWEAARPIPDRQAFASVYSDDGVRRLAAGDFAGAIACLEKATRVDPEYAVAWVNLGGAFALEGRCAEARESYNRALELDPRDLSAISGLARVCRLDGELSQARRLEARAKRFRERNPYYLLHLADRAAAGGDLDLAAKWLAKAYRIKSNDAEVIGALADLARMRGREREAERWRRRLEVLPQDDRAGMEPGAEK